MTEYLPPDIIDSIIYRYKSAVLDNRHDFGLTAADLAKIEEQLKAAYQPYIYKSETFCPNDYNPTPRTTTANGLNIKDEDAFLQQIGINRQLDRTSRNWGMRTIMDAPGGTPSLASKYYTDFTKNHNVKKDDDGNTFTNFMKKVCPTGVWNLVVDTISTGIQVGIKDFACNPTVGGGQSGGALPNYNRLTWVNSAETTFDPAGKVVPKKGVGATAVPKSPKAKAGLGISPKLEEMNGIEWCIREKTILGHTLFPSFKTLNVRPGTPLKDVPGFDTPSAAAIHAAAVKEKIICPPFIKGSSCSQPSGPRINFFSNYDIHMSKDSKETRALMMRDEENDAWMANKDFAKRTTQIKNLSTTSILKSFKQLFKGLPGIRDALKIIFPTKLTTQHYVCKRLGDAGQALLCVAMDNCILITGDRPLVAIAMMYRVPVIIYNNTTHQGNTPLVASDNKNNSYSIFHLETMLSFESKVDQNEKLIIDLEGRLATLLDPGQASRKEKILTAAKEKLKKITESISSLIAIVKVKLGEKVALEEEVSLKATPRTPIKDVVDEGNRAWRVLILLLYYTMPLFDQYKSLKASKEVTSAQYAPIKSLAELGFLSGDLTDDQKTVRSNIFKLYEERITLLQEKVGTLEFQKKMEKVFALPLPGKVFDFVNKNPTLWDRPFGFIYILQQLIQPPSSGFFSNIIGKKILTEFNHSVLVSINGATLSEKNFGTKGKLWKMSGAVKDTFKVALVDLLENYESATYSKPNGRGILSPTDILKYQSIERKVGSDRIQGTPGGTNLLFEILDILSGMSPTLNRDDAVENVGIEIKELLTAIFKPVIVDEEKDEKGEPTLNSKKQYPVNYTWIRRQQEAYHSTISKFLPQMSGGSMRGGDDSSCPTNVTTTLTIQEDRIPARAVTSPPSGFAWKISFPAVENVVAKAEAGLNNNYLGYSNLTLTKNIYNNVITSTATLAFNLNLLKTMKYWEWSTEIENCLAYKVLHNFMIKMNFPIETRDTAYEVKMAPIYAKTDGNLGGGGAKNPLQIMAEVGNSDFIDFVGNKKPELHEIPIPLIKALNKKLELENPRPNAEDASQILYDCKEESKIKPDLTIPPNESECTIGYPPFVAEAEKIVLNQEKEWAKATYRFFESGEFENGKNVMKNDVFNILVAQSIEYACFNGLRVEEEKRDIETQSNEIMEKFKGGNGEEEEEEEEEEDDAMFELKGNDGKYGPGFYLKPGVEQAIFEYYYSPQYLRGVPTDGMNFDLSCATPVEKLDVIKATVIRIFLGDLADIIDNAQSVPFEPGSQCVEEIADPHATTSSNVFNDAPTRVPINMVEIEWVIKRFIRTMTILDIGGKDCLRSVNTTDQAIVVLDEIVDNNQYEELADTSEYFKSNIFPTQYNEFESDDNFFELCVEPLFIMLNEQRNMFYEQGDSLLLEKMAKKTEDKCTEEVFAKEAQQSVVMRQIRRRRHLQAALKRKGKGGKKTRRKKRKRYKTKRKKKRKQKRKKKKTKRKRRKKHKTKYSKH